MVCEKCNEPNILCNCKISNCLKCDKPFSECKCINIMIHIDNATFYLNK